MRTALSLAAVALCLSPLVKASGSAQFTMEVPLQQTASGPGPFRRPESIQNVTADLLKLKRGPASLKETPEEKQARRERARARNERAQRKLQSYRPDGAGMTKMTEEEILKISEEDHPWVRRVWGGGSGGTYADFMADPGADYDKWQQAYRMLGGYIDCDHQKSEDEHHGQEQDGDNNNDNGDNPACSRWMIWAAVRVVNVCDTRYARFPTCHDAHSAALRFFLVQYVDPDYSGQEYYEYYGDSPNGILDCHSPDTNWQLLGVYRQEFYQYIEQISKHLWAIDSYEYVTAVAGLAYMTKYDCWSLGDYDNDGNEIYAGVAPQKNGEFQMALYTDGGMCIFPNNDLGKTFDSYGLTSNIQLGDNKDRDDDGGNDDYGDLYDYWTEAQEYTLTNLNDVYAAYRYCTSCVDYPTYQDGYFIGDDGTDDDDLINQCWKFHSHSSYQCDADCIAKAHAQNTILSVTYNGQTFGSTPSSFYDTAYGSNGIVTRSKSETKMTKLMANVFVAFSFIVFVATFLAFAVARRSRQREKRSSKSRRLLDDDGRSKSSRRSSRRKEGDGLFRARSKSADGRSRSSSHKRSKSSSKSVKSRSKSSSRRQREPGYEPPTESTKEHRSSTRSSSRSRRPLDDF